MTNLGRRFCIANRQKSGLRYYRWLDPQPRIMGILINPNQIYKIFIYLVKISIDLVKVLIKLVKNLIYLVKFLLFFGGKSNYFW